LFLSGDDGTAVYFDQVDIVCRDSSLCRCAVSSYFMKGEKGSLILAGTIRPLNGQSFPEEDSYSSGHKYREILSTIEEGYYEADLEGRLTFFNDAACRMFGYTRDEFADITYLDICRDPATVFNKFRLVYQTGRPDSGFVMETARKDGSPIFIEVSISLLNTREGKIGGFRGIARDITERIVFQQQLEFLGMHDQLTGLYNRNYFEEELKRISKGRDYPVTLISADINGLKLINDTMGHDQGDLLIKAAADVLKDSLRGSDILSRVGGDEFTALLVGTDEKTADRIMKRIRTNVKQYCRNNPDLFLSLSLGMATAHDNSMPFQELFKRADDAMYRDKYAPSSSAKGKIMKSLMNALAEKDYIVDGHARRLALLCRKLGRELGLSPRRQADLALLSQVHDLGKVGIPDAIIYKEGPLNENEWAIMKQHPEKGYRIALSSNYLTNVAGLILKHHERWDGSGYPLGLKGSEIPLECRILSVVDSYDTMTSGRPYCNSRSREEAVGEIRRCAGSQFDPEIVNVFLEMHN